MASQDAGKAPVQVEVEQVLSRCRALSQRVATYCNKIVGEADALAVEIKSMQQSISAMEKAAKATADPATRQALQAQLQEAKDVVTGLGPGGDLRKFCKPRNPWLVRLLLGDKINLVAIRRDVSQGIREEYHQFRERSTAIMLLGPLSLVIGMTWADRGMPFGTGRLTPGLLTGVQVYLAWLSYFYLAMALRENVLYVNGSHIKGWWIQHHYWSAAASLLMLGLPIHSPAVHYFFRSFLLWSTFQAVVMFVQNRYQRRRMYTRIALGRNSAMDVVAGESSGSSGQLLLLYPMLFLLQFLQFAIGAGVAVKTYPAWLSREGWLEVEDQALDLRGMRGVCLVGVTFAYMAYRNFITTIVTMMEKKRSGRGRGDSSRGGQRRPAAAPSVQQQPGSTRAPAAPAAAPAAAVADGKADAPAGAGSGGGKGAAAGKGKGKGK